ncbi:MAG: type II 3-dehydroquinate dehydratase [Deltaproteobacteria bacterium RBG_13_61_14]|nr:MAG: type II 3-dehydroquinate dehydratase [Deltaproteobacteria bacterium RBG_13_61_14]
MSPAPASPRKRRTQPRPAVLVLHGPNLNLLGRREPEHYGTATLAQIDAELKKLGRALKLRVECFQSNHEGELVQKIQQARGRVAAILINPGGYTHTSVAIRDALAFTELPVIEVHLSNLAKREEFRKRSLVSDLAVGTISGFGPHSYFLALRAAAAILKTPK